MAERGWLSSRTHLCAAFTFMVRGEWLNANSPWASDSCLLQLERLARLSHHALITWLSRRMDSINQIAVALTVQAIAVSEDDRIRIIEDLSREFKFGGDGNSMDAFFSMCLPGSISDQRTWIEACVSMDDARLGFALVVV